MLPFANGARLARLACISVFFVACLSGAAWAQGLYKADVAAALAGLTAADRAAWQAKYDAAQAATPEFRVSSVEEFIKINAWWNAHAHDGEVVHQFTSKLGEAISCIDIRTQRAFLANGGDPAHFPTPPDVQPQALESRPGDAEGPIPVTTFGLDGSPDEAGRARQCPEGSFPKVIRPLEHFYRFETLAGIFHKDPARGPNNPAASKSSKGGPPHHYTAACPISGGINIKGLQATFNLWQVNVEQHSEFSLMQLWVIHSSSAGVNTAETGVIHYYDEFGNDNRDLFIYYTADGYGSDGCWNLDCAGFVQKDNSVPIGGGFANYSAFGGAQYEISLAWLRKDDGNWWLNVGGTWVGYYPSSLYAADGLVDNGVTATNNTTFGGEIEANNLGDSTHTQMGSGRFWVEGWQYAAYIRQCQYYDMSQNLHAFTGLWNWSSDPQNWACGPIVENDPNWGTYFYMGGPGVEGCDATSCSNGCCDGSRYCQPGDTNAVCGTTGQTCKACGYDCVNQQCDDNLSGACCDRYDACFNTTGAQCDDAIGGIWYAGNCGSHSCGTETGACCLHNGGCNEMVTQSACNAISGTWNADNACAFSSCPPAGACCDRYNACYNTTSELCTDEFDGTWYDGDCKGHSCGTETGACCHTDGNCSEQYTLAQCNGIGGSWNADQDCLSSNCSPVSGACCDHYNFCFNATGPDCTDLYDGAWFAGNCNTHNCGAQTGACCQNNGDCGEMVTQANCTGTWHGDESCRDAGCGDDDDDDDDDDNDNDDNDDDTVPGACCDSYNACFNVSQQSCGGYGGTWQAGNCNSVNCGTETGACCVAGNCTDKVAQAACTGVWTGDNSCHDVVCADDDDNDDNDDNDDDATPDDDASPDDDDDAADDDAVDDDAVDDDAADDDAAPHQGGGGSASKGGCGC